VEDSFSPPTGGDRQWSQIGSDSRFSQWLPDGKSILVSASEKHLRLIGLTGTTQGENYGPSKTVMIEALPSPDGKLVAMGAYRGDISIWNVASRMLVGRIPKVGFYSHFVWSNDSQNIYYPGEKQIEVWNIKSKDSRPLSRNFSYSLLQSMALNPDNSILAIGDNSGVVSFLSTDSGAVLNSTNAHGTTVRQLAWSPNGNHLASIAKDGVMLIWNHEGSKIVREFRHGGQLRDVEWKSLERLMIASDERVFELDVSEGSDPRVLQTIPDQSVFRNTLSFNKAGDLLFADERKLFLQQTRENKAEEIFEAKSKNIRRACISPDGKFAAWAQTDGPIVVIEIPSGKTILKTDPLSWLDTFCFSPDSSKIASAHHHDATGIRVWDVEAGTSVSQVKTRNRQVITGISWSPDGKYLTSQNSAGAISIWNAESGSKITENKETDSGFGCGVKWEPNGSRIASISERGWITIRTFDGKSLSSRKLPNRESGISDIDWSPDGSRIASVSSEGVIRLINTETGEISLRQKAGRKGPYHREYLDIEWNPDGKKIAYRFQKSGEIRFLLAPEWVSTEK